MTSIVTDGKITSDEKLQWTVELRNIATTMGQGLYWTDDMINDLFDFVETLTFNSFNADEYYRSNFSNCPGMMGPKEKVTTELALTTMITFIIRERHSRLVTMVDKSITADLIRTTFRDVPEFADVLTNNGSVDNRKRKRKERIADYEEVVAIASFAKELIYPLMLFTRKPNKYLSANTAKYFSNYDLNLESGVPSKETMRYQYVYHSFAGTKPERRTRNRQVGARINGSVENFKANLDHFVSNLYERLRPLLKPIYDYVGRVEEEVSGGEEIEGGSLATPPPPVGRRGRGRPKKRTIAPLAAIGLVVASGSMYAGNMRDHKRARTSKSLLEHLEDLQGHEDDLFCPEDLLHRESGGLMIDATNTPLLSRNHSLSMPGFAHLPLGDLHMTDAGIPPFPAHYSSSSASVSSASTVLPDYLNESSTTVPEYGSTSDEEEEEEEEEEDNCGFHLPTLTYQVKGNRLH